MSRSVGVRRDLRLGLKDVYSGYSLFNFRSYLGINGDTYDRFLIRMLEMGESLNIASTVIYQLLNLLSISKQELFTSNISNNNNNAVNSYTSMEDLITHFIT